MRPALTATLDPPAAPPTDATADSRTAAASTVDAPAATAGPAGGSLLRVLTFGLDGRVYGVDVRDVVEVIRMVAITPLPGGTVWVAGVLNHRGRVIPVVDLRTRLGLAHREPGLSTPLIVVAAKPQPAALLVDEADDVIALPADAVSPPDPGTASTAVAALARHGKRLIVLLDVTRLCTDRTGDRDPATPGGGRHADIR